MKKLQEWAALWKGLEDDYDPWADANPQSTMRVKRASALLALSSLTKASAGVAMPSTSAQQKYSPEDRNARDEGGGGTRARQTRTVQGSGAPKTALGGARLAASAGQEVKPAKTMGWPSLVLPRPSGDTRYARACYDSRPATSAASGRESRAGGQESCLDSRVLPGDKVLAGKVFKGRLLGRPIGDAAGRPYTAPAEVFDAAKSRRSSMVRGMICLSDQFATSSDLLDDTAGLVPDHEALEHEIKAALKCESRLAGPGTCHS
jgi:hypothetical protein